MRQHRIARYAMAIAIITSSISCLPADQVKRYPINIVPVPFMLDGRSYLDGVDISTTEVYEMLAYKMPFRTSAPAPGDFIKAYHEALKKSDAVLCLTVPTKISMMYESASNAARQMPPGSKVHVMDAGTAAGGQALIDLAAARAAAAGATLEELIDLVKEIQSKVHLYGLIVAPQYLARTGRVPAPLPSAASFFSIKPVFTIGQGRVKFSGVVRSDKAGIERLISLMRETAEQKSVRVIVQHANAPKLAEDLRRRVEDAFNCSELLVTEFSPIIGFATGPGSLALAFQTEN
ncbi:MAG: DegV family protein [Chloroflexi bacterium]|nr:DegV family protein [Chloroflexota bacterium]MBM3183044.1 DegV family protein [Chloroflexota bacterium]MBM4452892.1 DegV family protein [Chloroflexota bacterium]